MAFLYCYSPISGQMWAESYYCYCCNGATHPTVFGGNWSSPIDVGGGGVADGDPMMFYAGNQPNCAGSPVLGSVGLKYLSGLCLSDPAPWTNAAQVDMYTSANGQGYVGSVLYGHVKETAQTGIYNIGPGGCSGLHVGDFASDCNCSCAHGIHTHMQRWNGVARQMSCGQNLTVNASWIYYW
jgi:hypothetical protein